MKIYKIELSVVDYGEVGREVIQDALENANYLNDCITPSVLSIEEQFFKDLMIPLSRDVFIDLIRHMPLHWERKTDWEDRSYRAGLDHTCFAYTGDDAPAAGFHLYPQVVGMMRVANVCPLEKGNLTVQEYNELIDLFVEEVLEPNGIGSSVT